MQAPRNGSRWESRLHRSGFFLGALLLHLLIFFMVATWVVYQPPPAQPDFSTRYTPVTAKAPVPPPAPAVPVAKIDSAAQASAPNVPVPIPTISATGLQEPASAIDWGKIRDSAPIASPLVLPANDDRLSPDRQKQLRDFRDKYQPQGNVVVITFPIYIAKYSGGDWACNTRLDKDGNIVAGSIPNLVAKINEWSRGTINGQVVPKPLDIGSTELLDKLPPFIFFTGHKDFVLTAKEVANLRDYLQCGGAIWGDNALAGDGSAFDIAFHREMQRVVPKHPFETMSTSDDIFTKGRFVISEVPAGMNFHSEPLEHLDIDGVLAILYTPNDYGDLCSMRILPGDTQIQSGRADPQSPLTTNWQFERHQAVFFRNFTLQSSLAVHRLGMDIVTYFLHRFDDQLDLGH